MHDDELNDLDLEKVAGGGSAAGIKGITKEAACLFCNMPGGPNRARVRPLNKAAKQQAKKK